jgi:hypothetical protein
MANGATISVLDQILEPVTDVLTPELAEAIAELKVNSAIENRISHLAERCNQGELTAAERSEYESYVQAVDLISLLQAKARLWLVHHSGS